MITERRKAAADAAYECADALAAAGTIGPELAVALKAEARCRVATNEFFGHVAYVSLTARKP